MLGSHYIHDTCSHCTSYSEVTGAISLTKIADPAVIRIAAVFGILFSVLGKVSAILKTIPEAVLGGIMHL